LGLTIIVYSKDGQGLLNAYPHLSLREYGYDELCIFSGVVNVAIGFLITFVGCAIASVFAILEFLYGAIMFLCQGVDPVPATV